MSCRLSGEQTVPAGQLCQPRTGAERLGEHGWPGCLSAPPPAPHAAARWMNSEDLLCNWKLFPKSQHELVLGAFAACPTTQSLLTPFEHPQFPSMWKQAAQAPFHFVPASTAVSFLPWRAQGQTRCQSTRTYCIPAKMSGRDMFKTQCWAHTILSIHFSHAHQDAGQRCLFLCVLYSTINNP